MTSPTQLQSEPSHSESSELDDLFGSMPDPELIETQDSLPTAPAEEKEKVASGVCKGCGEPIERKVGARGRLPSYHPHCRPTKGVSTGRGTKAVTIQNEAEAAVEIIRNQLMKGAFLLSMVDPYDGFVVAASIPDLCSQLYSIFVRYEKVRQEALAMAAGGSWLGLVFTLAMIMLPIMAHHNLIPGKFVREFLVHFPRVMFRVKERMEEGPQELAKHIETQMMAKMQAEANKRGRSAENS